MAWARAFSYVLGVAAVLALALCALYVTLYLSLGPEVLQRHIPGFVQSVTYSATVGLALGIGSSTARLAADGRKRGACLLLALGSFALLNFYYLWTSRAVMAFLSPFMATRYLDALQSYGFGFGVDGNLPVDLISIALAATFCVSMFLFYRERHGAAKVLRVAQFGGLAFLPLPIDVLLFDPSEFNIHVSSFQQHYSVLPSFTNAELLVLASLLFLGSTIVLRLRRKVES